MVKTVTVLNKDLTAHGMVAHVTQCKTFSRSPVFGMGSLCTFQASYHQTDKYVRHVYITWVKDIIVMVSKFNRKYTKHMIPPTCKNQDWVLYCLTTLFHYILCVPLNQRKSKTNSQQMKLQHILQLLSNVHLHRNVTTCNSAKIQTGYLQDKCSENFHLLHKNSFILHRYLQTEKINTKSNAEKYFLVIRVHERWHLQTY